MDFKDFWKIENGDDLRKSEDNLTSAELIAIQKKIKMLQQRGYPSSKIIKYLQDHNEKLVEKYRAEAAFWTELKKIDTERVWEASSELGITRYKAILSPSACPICVRDTKHGTKIFSNNEMSKGAGSVPPFHPNCYCIMVPVG